MKKIIFFAAALLFLFSLLFINNRKYTALHTMFEKWDNVEADTVQKNETIKLFADFLTKNHEISVEDIHNISARLKVYEQDELRIIEYIENPEFYGSSSRLSYHTAMYGDKVKVLNAGGSIKIDEIINLNESLYYMYATDYRFSNITGINIFRIAINEDSFECVPIISMDNPAEGFKLLDALYYDSGHIYFHSIEDDGSRVLIEINKVYYELLLKEDGMYHLTSVNDNA